MTSSTTAPAYIIEFYGGPSDGYSEPTDFVPLANRLYVASRADREEIYEWTHTSARLVDGLPVMVFQYHFAGRKFPPAARQKWREQLFRVFRSIAAI